MTTGKKIKVAVSGVGFIGPVHIESLRRTAMVDVVAIVHPNEEEAKQKATQLGIPAYYTRFDDLLQKENFECVHICTPNFMHYAEVKGALLAGKHVVCEKPLAISSKEAEELVALAKEKKLVNAVNFNIRYYPLVRQMKLMREKGELGKMHSVTGSYLQDWLYYETDYNWRLEKAMSGDSKAVADIGSHLLDLIEYVSGLQVTQVMADFSTIHPIRKKPNKPVETYSGKLLKAEDYDDVPISTEDYASILLRFSDGSKGVATVSQVAAGRKNRVSVEFSGSKQTFSWCSEQPNDLWIGKRNEPNAVLMRDPALVHEEARSIISYPGGHNEGFGDTTKQLYKEIYAAVANGVQPVQPAYPTFEDGLRELWLCEKIVESHQQQRWITV